MCFLNHGVYTHIHKYSGEQNNTTIYKRLIYFRNNVLESLNCNFEDILVVASACQTVYELN